MAAWAMPCSLWARYVGSSWRAACRASPMPATLPWPKIAQHPANSGTSWPSISARWAHRNLTKAWAMVRRTVGIGPPSGSVVLVLIASDLDRRPGLQRLCRGIGQHQRAASVLAGRRRGLAALDRGDEGIQLGLVGFGV